MPGFERTVFITNPKSRSGAEPCAGLINELLPVGPVHAFQADDSNGAEAAIREFGGPKTRVVLGGGDGTISFYLQAIVDTGSTLAVLPLGTANDFARSLGMPVDLSSAIDIAVNGTTRKVDLGEINGKLFLNAVGVGMGPRMAQELDRETKENLGVLAYPLSLFSTLKEAKPFEARLEIDGKQHVLDCLQVTIGNGIHYGGGMTVSAQSRLDNGELSVLCIRRQPAWQLATHALALRNGAFGDEEDIEVFSGKQVRLRTPEPMSVTADGDPAGETPLICSVHPGSLNVLVADENKEQGATT